VSGPDEAGAPASAAASTAEELADVLGSASEDLPGVTVDAASDATIWAAAGVPFAVLSGRHAEFRLDPLVARAALRTTDTTPSARGADWVAFEPAELDDAAIDRVEAWFLSAYRRAIGATRRGGAAH
jgi:hypothetical protein